MTSVKVFVGSMAYRLWVILPPYLVPAQHTFFHIGRKSRGPVSLILCFPVQEVD